MSRINQYFINKKIDILSFQIAFCKRYESVQKVTNLLKSNRIFFSPNKKSFNFVDLLLEIDFYSKVYSSDLEIFRNKFEIRDVEFRILIEKILKVYP